MLVNHQKRAKSCLLVQKNINNNIISDLIKCEFCELEMDPKNIPRHHNTCIKRFRKIIEEKDNIIEEKNNIIIEKDKIINDKDKTINDIITQLEIYKELSLQSRKTVEDIAKQNYNNTDNSNVSDSIDIVESKSQSISKDILNSQKNNNEIILFKLSLDNKNIVDIPVRKDGMINATLLCKAGGKLFADYKRSKQTDSYLHALELIMGIPIIKLLITEVGKYGGTWVHRKVAIHLSQWISPYFAVQVTNWMDELLVCGKLELENKFQSIINNTTEKKLSVYMDPFHEKDVLYIYNVTPKEELNI